jgi:hypothetical protein
LVALSVVAMLVLVLSVTVVRRPTPMTH